MGKRHAVFDQAGVRLFAREDLLKKSFRILDLFVLTEQLNDLPQRVWKFSGPKPEDNVSFVEKISDGDSHGVERFVGLSGKASYPVK
jgi:hypothetical protein